MKLFVWHDVLCDYTGGVMFALAHNVQEARAVISKKAAFSDGTLRPSVEEELCAEPSVYDEACGFYLYGGS